jgi:hypothetical protein
MKVVPETLTLVQIDHHAVEAVGAKNDNQQYQEFLAYGAVHAV